MLSNESGRGDAHLSAKGKMRDLWVALAETVSRVVGSSFQRRERDKLVV
jgi:hypothetical protein